MKNAGAEVSYYDPYIPVIKPTREHAHWTGVKSIDWNEQTIRSFDAVLVATAHANFNYHELGTWAALIVDTRNAMKASCDRSAIINA
jgi:UDP-N-acetyl-D-glucosamine dehydrogenase